MSDQHLTRRGFLTRLGGLLGLAALPGLSACLAPQPFEEEAWQRQVAAQDPGLLRAPHRDADGTFFNPWQREDRGWADFLLWLFSANSVQAAAASAPQAIPRQENQGEYLGDPGAPPSLTWLGHCAFALHWGAQVVLTDPVFGAGSPLLPRRQSPAAFGPEKIPPGAVALISHNHYDHLDEESLAALGDKVTVLCPLGLAEPIRQMGAIRVAELDWWQSVELEGSVFTCLPAQHWSRRWGQERNQTLWCVWLMQRGGRTVFFGGDTGYFAGFKEYGRLWPGMDLAILPLGASQPRWFMHQAHLDPREFLLAGEDLGTRLMIPAHWGAFKLGDEPAWWPPLELARLLEERPRLRELVRTLPVGGRLML